jgi:oxygen-dependent protoporphyrinogen oxidase
MTGLVDNSTIRQLKAEPARSLQWRPGSDPAVGDVVGERFGAQVVARSVDPMLSGVYAGSATTIGIRSAVPSVAAALDKGAPSLTEAVRRSLPPTPGAGGAVFGAVDGGYEVLLGELVRRTAMNWVATSIERIDADGPGWSVRDAEGTHWHADAVVLALPAPRLAALVAGVAPRTAAAAGRIRTASSVVVALALDGATRLPDQSGVLMASGERLHAKAITLSTRKWGRRGDVELVRVSFGRYGDSVARDASDEELLAWAVADVASIFSIDVDPVEVRVQRWIDAMPQYGPGHAALVAELRSGLPARLAVAGSYLDGIGVPACIAAATHAATAVASG